MKTILDLGQTPFELQALVQQGFVAVEPRGARLIYKLRYRVAGRQRVRSLGSDPLQAQLIADELAKLQAARRQQLTTKRIVKHARRALRKAKRRLTAVATAEGVVFHGYSIRANIRSAVTTVRRPSFSVNTMTLMHPQSVGSSQHDLETSSDSVDRFALRRKRIAEYATQALREADPRDAVIDSEEADIMFLKSFVSEALHSELEGKIPSVQSLEEVVPVFVVHSQLTKLGVSIAKVKERRLARQARATAIEALASSPLAVSDQRSVDTACDDASSAPDSIGPWTVSDQPPQQAQ
jgi:hypothetical protein